MLSFTVILNGSDIVYLLDSPILQIKIQYSKYWTIYYL
jgi:hypothetical protein